MIYYFEKRLENRTMYCTVTVFQAVCLLDDLWPDIYLNNIVCCNWKCHFELYVFHQYNEWYIHIHTSQKKQPICCTEDIYFSAVIADCNKCLHHPHSSAVTFVIKLYLLPVFDSRRSSLICLSLYWLNPISLYHVKFNLSYFIPEI